MPLRRLAGVALAMCIFGAACASGQSQEVRRDGDSSESGTGGVAAPGNGGGGEDEGGEATAAMGGLASGSGGSAGSEPGGAGSEPGGSAGSDAGSGSGGSPTSACPDAAPDLGAPCAGELTCLYEDCAGAGRIVARCAEAAWSVATSACTPFDCEGTLCQPGEICSVLAGGALVVSCTPNPCEARPFSCECASPDCPQCAVSGVEGSGFTLVCNTCPAGMACP